MRVAVTGATGTIGGAVVAALLERGDDVVALSRDAARARERLGERVEAFSWPDPASAPPAPDALAGCDGVVNVIGEGIDQRWTDDAKRRIRESRIPTTRNLVDALRKLDPRPRVLVSQSASGFYGPRGDEPVEESEPPGDDFLADVLTAFEREALRGEELDMRVVLARSAVVLSDTGALGKMLPFFKLGVGGPVAGGRQYFPWIHLDDEAAALIFLLDTEAARGPVNLAAPEPATNADLSRTLGRVLRRPAVLPVPKLALQVLYGDMSQVVTGGVRLSTRKLEELGYRFRWPELEPALRDAVSG